jgi:hypothetical protein
MRGLNAKRKRIFKTGIPPCSIGSNAHLPDPPLFKVPRVMFANAWEPPPSYKLLGNRGLSRITIRTGP